MVLRLLFEDNMFVLLVISINVSDKVMTLEHQDCAQTKFVRNRHNYADRHNPIAHVTTK